MHKQDLYKCTNGAGELPLMQHRMQLGDCCLAQGNLSHAYEVNWHLQSTPYRLVQSSFEQSAKATSGWMVGLRKKHHPGDCCSCPT